MSKIRLVVPAGRRTRARIAAEAAKIYGLDLSDEDRAAKIRARSTKALLSAALADLTPAEMRELTLEPFRDIRDDAARQWPPIQPPPHGRTTTPEDRSEMSGGPS